MDEIRGDIAFYAFIICANVHSAAGDLLVSFVWMAAAVVIFVVKRNRKADRGVE